MKSFKSKTVFYVIILFITCLIVSCNKSQDPYDDGFSSEEWTPSYLLTELSDSGVWLRWEQPVENIDGFILERSADSINWEFLSKKMIENEIREYLDSTVVSGEVIFYRIYAKAGSNISDYCYSDVVIVPLQLPTVVTQEVTSIKSSSARFNGAVTKDGGKPVTERGFCYSLSVSPTIKDKKVAVGLGTGVYTNLVDDLKSGTSYYLRAYATNDNGTAYGGEKMFKTLARLPFVTTINVSDVDSSSVNVLGEIISDGNGTITDCGFCYSENGIPNINSNKESCVVRLGTIRASLNNLKWATKYYVRAYAVNEIGVSYGDDITFFTKCNCEDKYGLFIDTRDNHTYKTIKIGTQTWMAENLSYLPYTTPYQNWVEDKPCYYSSSKYGIFYNKAAALTSCPVGWHLPSNDEWETLENYLIKGGYNYDHSLTENLIAKSLAFDSGWRRFNHSFIEGEVGYNQKQNNTSCFSAKAGNILYFKIHYGYTEGTTSYWWSSSLNENGSYYKGFGSYSYSLNSPSKLSADGLYVRCIKD